MPDRKGELHDDQRRDAGDRDDRSSDATATLFLSQSKHLRATSGADHMPSCFLVIASVRLQEPGWLTKPIGEGHWGADERKR